MRPRGRDPCPPPRPAGFQTAPPPPPYGELSAAAYSAVAGGGGGGGGGGACRLHLAAGAAGGDFQGLGSDGGAKDGVCDARDGVRVKDDGVRDKGRWRA
jgi:hypothetical protein